MSTQAEIPLSPEDIDCGFVIPKLSDQELVSLFTSEFSLQTLTHYKDIYLVLQNTAYIPQECFENSKLLSQLFIDLETTCVNAKYQYSLAILRRIIKISSLLQNYDFQVMLSRLIESQLMNETFQNDGITLTYDICQLDSGVAFLQNTKIYQLLGAIFEHAIKNNFGDSANHLFFIIASIFRFASRSVSLPINDALHMLPLCLQTYSDNATYVMSDFYEFVDNLIQHYQDSIIPAFIDHKIFELMNTDMDRHSSPVLKVLSRTMYLLSPQNRMTVVSQIDMGHIFDRFMTETCDSTDLCDICTFYINYLTHDSRELADLTSLSSLHRFSGLIAEATWKNKVVAGTLLVKALAMSPISVIRDVFDTELMVDIVDLLDAADFVSPQWTIKLLSSIADTIEAKGLRDYQQYHLFCDRFKTYLDDHVGESGAITATAKAALDSHFCL